MMKTGIILVEFLKEYSSIMNKRFNSFLKPFFKIQFWKYFGHLKYVKYFIDNFTMDKNNFSAWQSNANTDYICQLLKLSQHTYTWPLNNVSLNCICPLIRWLLSINTVLHQPWLAELWNWWYEGSTLRSEHLWILISTVGSGTNPAQIGRDR